MTRSTVAEQRAVLAALSDPVSLKPGPCWEWPLHRQRQTVRCYGLVAPSIAKACGSRSLLAHRVAYSIAFGPFDQSLLVCHRCDNPPCYRPSHLFLGTQFDNMRDMVTKGRGDQRKGYAHPRAALTPEQVALATELFSAGLTRGQIAQRIGVDRSTIGRLLSGQTSYLPEVERHAS